jgi:ATP/maltotriose-dependent transcriptional regulator MalT
MVGFALSNLGALLVTSGALAEARSVLERSLEMAKLHCDRRMDSASRIYLSIAHRLEGRSDEASRLVRGVVDQTEGAPPLQTYALAALAQALLAGGDMSGALEAALRARDLLVRLGNIDDGESMVRVTLAEVLLATGDADGARQAIRDARTRLLAQAENITRPAWRESFLERVPVHTRTMALAKEWIGPRERFTP